MNSLQSLFAQKSWANNELFNVVATVPEAAHATVLHAAIRMLNHIYVVDKIFQAHLLGEHHSYSSTNTEVLRATQISTIGATLCQVESGDLTHCQLEGANDPQ